MSCRDCRPLVVGRVRPTVLDEAREVMEGPRQSSYGDPTDTATRIGRAWAALLDLPEPIPAATVDWMMVALKGIRDTSPGGHPKRDNLVDACGYLRMAELAREVEDAEAHPPVRTGTLRDALGELGLGGYGFAGPGGQS